MDRYFTLVHSDCKGLNTNQCYSQKSKCQWKMGPARQYCSALQGSLERTIQFDSAGRPIQKCDDPDPLQHNCDFDYLYHFNHNQIIYKNNRKTIVTLPLSQNDYNSNFGSKSDDVAQEPQPESETKIETFHPVTEQLVQSTSLPLPPVQSPESSKDIKVKTFRSTFPGLSRPKLTISSSISPSPSHPKLLSFIPEPVWVFHQFKEPPASTPPAPAPAPVIIESIPLVSSMNPTTVIPVTEIPIVPIVPIEPIESAPQSVRRPGKWIDKCAANEGGQENVQNFIEQTTQFNIAEEAIQQGFKNPFKFRPLTESIRRSQGKILCLLTDFLLLYDPKLQEQYIYSNHFNDDPQSAGFYQWYLENYFTNPNLNNLNNFAQIFDIDPGLLKLIISRNLGNIKLKDINLNNYGLKDILNLYATKTYPKIVINPIIQRITQLFDPKILSRWNLGARVSDNTNNNSNNRRNILDNNNNFESGNVDENEGEIEKIIRINNFTSFGHLLSVLEPLIIQFS